jgi:hypothetical protein
MPGGTTNPGIYAGGTPNPGMNAGANNVTNDNIRNHRTICPAS